MPVTRTELVTHIEAAFTVGPATRDRMLAYAAGSHARPAVIEVLQALPDKTYADVRDLWYDLGDVPIAN